MAMGILASGGRRSHGIRHHRRCPVREPPAVMGVVFAWLIRHAEPNIDRIAATFD
jgi:hypothetical protein